MPFVTTLTLRSGDRDALDAVVDDIRGVAARKGIEFKGPHTAPPESYRVPQHRRLDGGDAELPAWNYTVYERTIEIAGHDETVRSIADGGFPRGIHVEIEVDRIRSVGSKW